MKAPKKIWVSDMGGWFETESSHDTPYIRADLVNELVGALEGLLENYLWERESHWGSNDYEEDECVIKTRTALAKIKEET